MTTVWFDLKDIQVKIPSKICNYKVKVSKPNFLSAKKIEYYRNYFILYHLTLKYARSLVLLHEIVLQTFRF